MLYSEPNPRNPEKTVIRNLLRRYLYLSVVALLCCVPAALASQTASMDLTGAGNNILGGVYVGPYTATINGVSTEVICDDWKDESSIGETWTANVTSLPSAGSLGSVVMWTGTGTVSQQVEYDEVAWLVSQMLNPSTTCKYSGADCVGDISFAIWQLTDPSANPFGNLTSGSADLENAEWWLSQAESLTSFPAGDFSNFLIYTPTNGGPPQEFIADPVLASESSPGILLGADLLGLAVLIFMFRRRMVQTQS